MNLITILLSLTALIDFFIVYLILSKSDKNTSDKVFIFLNIVIILWIVSDIFYSIASEFNLFWAKATYSAALFLPFAYLYFSLTFLSEKKVSKKTIVFSFLFPFILLILILINPESMIQKSQNGFIFGYIYFLYILYMASYFIISYIVLFRKILLFSGTKKGQINFIFYGSLISSILALTSALILPLFKIYDLYFLSPAFTLVLSVCITYAIFRHHLFNIKVIATEIFGALIVIIFLINALLSQSRAESFLNFGLFVVIIIFSILLIRGVLNEVRSREKIVKMAQNLKKANLELQKLDKAKSEFISIASHQLRTPVSVIKGVASMMIEGDLEKFSEEKKNKFIKSLWEKSCKLENIIDDILNATEMTNSKYRIRGEKAELIDIKELIKKIIKDFHPVIEKRGMSLSLKNVSNDLPKIYGQTQYLQEAFGNLIDNAIKYTPSIGTDYEARGKRDKKGIISISITKEENNVIISVEDNGIGIPQKESFNLFKKFTRGSNARDMYTDGSGLGLFVVKEIIEGHYGKVWFESELNKGTTFFVSLPINSLKEINVKKHIIDD